MDQEEYRKLIKLGLKHGFEQSEFIVAWVQDPIQFMHFLKEEMRGADALEALQFTYDFFNYSIEKLEEVAVEYGMSSGELLAGMLQVSAPEGSFVKQLQKIWAEKELNSGQIRREDQIHGSKFRKRYRSSI